MGFSRERRAHIARKLYYLDNYTQQEIVDHFEREGIASLTQGTISRYVNESSHEQTVRLVRENHADEDLRIAESQQRKHDRAREDERRATRDEPLQRVVPETAYVKEDMVDERAGGFRTRGWRFPDPDDGGWPEWAVPGFDSPIVFEGSDILRPGEQYPIPGLDGKPKYTTELAGVERDQPDLTNRRSARYEQKSHLETRAQMLGVGEERHHHEIEGDLDADVALPEETIEAIVSTSRKRLETNAGDPEDDPKPTEEPDND